MDKSYEEFGWLVFGNLEFFGQKMQRKDYKSEKKIVHKKREIKVNFPFLK